MNLTILLKLPLLLGGIGLLVVILAVILLLIVKKTQ